MSKRTIRIKSPSDAPHMQICVLPIGEAAQITCTHEPVDNLDRSLPCPAYVRLAALMVQFGERPEETAIKQVRELVARRTPEQRLYLWALLQEGFCSRCGGPSPCDCRGVLVISTTLG